MKKFISIVLTICMLFSLITVTTAAETSEGEGDAGDILINDIKNVTERIYALKDIPYSTGLNDEFDAIVAEVESIKDRGGEISVESQAIIERLHEQKNEEPYYITTKLKYTRDIFEDLELFKAQATIDEVTREHIFPADAWQPTVNAGSVTSKFAFDEDAFGKKTGIDSNNYVVKNGIPYQFGPIKSAVHGKNNEPNSINAADSSSVIEIDVEQLPYEEFYLAGWSRNNGSENTAVITYNYADGSTSTETNLKVFKGGISLPTVDAYTEILNNDLSQGIPYWRAPQATSASEKKNGWGGYRIFIVSHRLTPDDTKTLKSIKIQPSNQDLNVLALTGKLANSGILLNKLDETMAALKGDITNKQVNEFVSYAEKYIEVLEKKGVAYNPTYDAEIQKYKEKYITDFEECVKALSDRFVFDEVEILLNAQKYYSVINALKISTDCLNKDLLDKYNLLLEEYDTCTELEEEIAAWNDEYKYSMYVDVRIVKAVLDKLSEKALSPEIKAQFEKIYSWAIRTKNIDERIAVLPNSYSEENKEEIIALMDEIQVLYNEGCTANSFANGVKLVALYSKTGMCGESTTWSLNEDGVLTISGTGAMINFIYVNDTPWYSAKDNITKVVIDNGVTNIGSFSFNSFSGIEEVQIGTGVKEIGLGAFCDCTGIFNIEIPANVEKICEEAFMGCNSLAIVELKEGLKEISKAAFDQCTSLIEINIPKTVEKIGAGAFVSCESLNKIEIPEGIETIDEATFSGCSNLSEVNLPENLKEIKLDAFYKCSSLKEIIIPDSVTTIGGWAFYRCTGLKNLTMSRNVKFIGLCAFYNCGLETVSYKNSEEDWAQIEIGTGNESLEVAQKIFVKNILPEIVTNELTTIVKAKLYNTDSLQGVMMAVGYNNDSIRKIKNTAVTTEEPSVDMEGKYEKIKVFLWESLGNLKPICNAETVK